MATEHPVPVTRFSTAFKPLTQISPTTFRDGYTFLELYENLKSFLLDVITPELDERLKLIYEETQREVNRLAADMNASVAQWDALFNLFMDNVIEELEALNDVAVTNLVNDTGSSLRGALNALFAAKSSVTQLETLVNQGRLSEQVISETLTPAGSEYRSFTTTYFPEGSGMKERYITRIKNGDKMPMSVAKLTAGGTHPAKETLRNLHKRGGGNVTINASGWWETGRLMGLQIVNGEIVQGWETHGDAGGLGVEAMVFMRDGSLQLFDLTTTPESIVSQGGLNSFSWGHAVYKNGVLTNFMSHPRYSIYSARQLVGATVEGDIIIATFPGVTNVSGALGIDIVTALSQYNFRVLYVLDGGSSAQLLVNGEYVVRSSFAGSPESAVPDALSISAPIAGKLPRQWRSISDRQNGFGGGGVNVLNEGSSVRVRVAVVPTGEVAAGSLVTIAQLPDDIPLPIYHATALAYVSSHVGNAYNARVTTGGEIQVTIPADSNGAVSFDLSYSTVKEFV